MCDDVVHGGLLLKPEVCITQAADKEEVGSSCGAGSDSEDADEQKRTAEGTLVAVEHRATGTYIISNQEMTSHPLVPTVAFHSCGNVCVVHGPGSQTTTCAVFYYCTTTAGRRKQFGFPG